VSQELPTLEEFVLGVFLHDIGKFTQRAYGSLRSMDPEVRDRQDEVLPQYEGRRTHWHALWTEAFFHELEKNHVRLPGADFNPVRDIAVYHHAPSPNIPLTELAAVADRLAAGMDRKQRDEQTELEGEAKGWDAFIRTALKNPFAGVDLEIGLGKPPESEIPLGPLIPDDRLRPQPKVATDDYQNWYRSLWDDFLGKFLEAARLPSFDLFAEALLSLSERFTFAIPSSTVDEPDISLHDHQRTAAALAAALYRWHEREGSLRDSGRIRDPEAGRFRFLCGDLSGIQRTLFRLAAEQIKGLNKILRARSLLMALTAEAAALAARRALGLPVFSLLQNAGGRFLLLVADLPDLRDRVEALRSEMDPWMRERYFGDLALILSLSEPFGKQDLMRGNFRRVLESLGASVEQAKLRAFSRASHPVQRADYPYGPCNACGMRPAQRPEPDNRCPICAQEHELGGELPRIEAFCWRPATDGRIRFFGELALDWRFEPTRPYSDWLSAFRLFRGDALDSILPLRFLAGYVPRLDKDEADKPAYRALLSDEAREIEPGDLKTFEHLAADGVEFDEEKGELLGENFLAVFKADVDRLGVIFTWGLRTPALSRFAALSRMLDFFFSGYLPELLRKQFPSIYTVYAGGDDMLLVGPWRQVLEMATAMREKFRRWTGSNPNLSISAGIELFKPQQPVGPAVARAEERLNAAKKGGRDRVCAIADRALPWEDFERAFRDSETLNDYLRHALVNPAFLYRLLHFADERARAEAPLMDLRAADWRARWGYYLARHMARLPESLGPRAEELRKFANRLLGLDADLKKAALPSPPRLAVSIALYRNRNPKSERR